MESPRWLELVSSAVAALLALTMIGGPLLVLYRNQRPAEMPVQRRLAWNLKTSTRLDGATPAMVAVAASRARFPDPGRWGPGAAVLVSGRDPARALAAAPLAAPPVNAALFAVSPQDAAPVQAEVARLGAPRLYTVGPPTPAPAGAAGASMPAGMQLGGAGGDPVQAAADAARVRATALGAPPERVIVADVREAADLVPLIPWLALSGDAVLFTRDGTMPAATAQALAQLGTVRSMYRTPRAAAVPGSAARRVRQLTTFPGARGAVSFAEYYDEPGGLGWGYGRERRNGYHHYILARTGDWQSVLGAANIAPANRTPLLWVESPALGGVTEAYLWKVRPEFYNSPAEGPFYHTWVAGDTSRVAFGAQARSDLALEISQYRIKGEGGASALELLMIGWMALSLLLAVWVALHVLRRMRGMHWTMRWGWPLLVLVAGPVGFWMYLSLYRRRPRSDMTMMGSRMSMWHRGHMGQVAAATAMGVAFDMPLMVAVSYLVTLVFGMPPVIFDGPFFWLGISMVVTMLIAYVVPIVLGILLFEAPMQMMFRRVGYAGGLRHAWKPMLAAMTAGWIGMMGSMFWFHMIYPRGMFMPEEDQVRWWGFVLAAVLIGVLFEWLVNFWVVRRQLRPGSM